MPTRVGPVVRGRARPPALRVSAIAGLLTGCGPQTPSDPDPLAPDGTVACRAEIPRDPTRQNAEMIAWPGLDGALPAPLLPARCPPEDDRPLASLPNRERSCRSGFTDPRRVLLQPPLPPMPGLEDVLGNMEEPSLTCGYPPGAELYRWTSMSPLAGYATLRVEIVGDAALLIAKAWPVARPPGSPAAPGRLTYAVGSRRLTDQDLTKLRAAIGAGGFWERDGLPALSEDLPTDLAPWTLEGARAGTYHVIAGFEGLSDISACGLCQTLSATLRALSVPPGASGEAGATQR